LAPAEHVLDRAGRLAARLLVAIGLGVGIGLLVGVGQRSASRVAEIRGVVAGVEERVLGQADVDEGGLHPGQDVRHRALVDAAHDGSVTVTLEVELGEEVTFLDRDSGFE
jgi:hypothetical protein